MNRRDFFKRLLGAGAGVAAIALLPSARPEVMTASKLLAQNAAAKIRLPVVTLICSEGTIKKRKGYVNYVPGASFEIGESMEQTYQRLDIGGIEVRR